MLPSVDMAPRLVAIHGSARPGGNSRRLLEELIEAVRSTEPDVTVELIEAYGVDVGPCTHCAQCEDEGEGCTIEEDEWERIEASLRAADLLVIASPVYFKGLPAPLKTLVDRCQAMWWLRERGGKVAINEGPYRRAAIILTAAGGKPMFTGAKGVATAALNTLEFDTVGALLAGDLEGPEAATGRDDLLEQARDLGRALVS
jgi:multimeric flavodoxin WrbA